MAEPLKGDGPFHILGWVEPCPTCGRISPEQPVVVRVSIGQRDLAEVVVEGQRARRDEKE